jgi:hypothetical protein
MKEIFIAHTIENKNHSSWKSIVATSGSPQVANSVRSVEAD